MNVKLESAYFLLKYSKVTVCFLLRNQTFLGGSQEVGHRAAQIWPSFGFWPPSTIYIF